LRGWVHVVAATHVVVALEVVHWCNGSVVDAVGEHGFVQDVARHGVCGHEGRSVVSRIGLTTSSRKESVVISFKQY